MKPCFISYLKKQTNINLQQQFSAIWCTHFLYMIYKSLSSSHVFSHKAGEQFKTHLLSNSLVREPSVSDQASTLAGFQTKPSKAKYSAARSLLLSKQTVSTVQLPVDLFPALRYT